MKNRTGATKPKRLSSSSVEPEETPDFRHIPQPVHLDTRSKQTWQRTYEGQDAEAEVVSEGGDDGAHPQHGERGVAAGDDQVTGQIPEHVPAQQVTLTTVMHVNMRLLSCLQHGSSLCCSFQSRYKMCCISICIFEVVSRTGTGTCQELSGSAGLKASEVTCGHQTQQDEHDGQFAN